MEGDSLIQYALELWGQSFPIVKVLFFTIIIVVYAIFVFFFYRQLAKKNIVNLNLQKYNTSVTPATSKLVGFMTYLLEYIILLPVMTIFWFGIISILLLVIAKGLEVEIIMVIAAALITSVRITSYISEKLSQDLAKMIPFTILALAITGEGFFSIGSFVARIMQIPEVIYALPHFIIFIIGVELLLRTYELIIKFIVYGDEINEEKEPKN